MSGAYGSGAAFALEDAWTLGAAVAHSVSHDLPLAEALRLFDETRSPYYEQLYAELGRIGAATKKGEGLEWHERVRDRIDERWSNLDWIYQKDVSLLSPPFLSRRRSPDSIFSTQVEVDWQGTLARELAKKTEKPVEALEKGLANVSLEKGAETLVAAA